MIHKDAKIGLGVMIWFRELSNIGNCTIGDGSIVHSPVWIGDGVIIGKRNKIQALSFLPKGVETEDDVFIGPGVVFTNDKNPPSQGKGWSKTLVRRGAVIGANATILPGLEIGENATIGAGAVVTKSVEAGKTVVGNPARAINNGLDDID